MSPRLDSMHSGDAGLVMREPVERSLDAQWEMPSLEDLPPLALSPVNRLWLAPHQGTV
jgi:hypothetical protein